MDNLDLVILKTICNNKKFGLDFVHDSNEKLFDSNLWRFAKLVIDYIRLYKNIPTKRVLVEQNSKNDQLVSYISKIWDQIHAIEYDEKEYLHDLDKLKKRYAAKLLTSLKENISIDDQKKSVSDLTATLQNIKNLNQAKAYNQNTIKAALPDFRNRYTAKLNDPNFGLGLLTGYSWLDFTLGGLRLGEMALIAADTGGGKSMMLMNLAINMWMQGNSLDRTDNFDEGCDVLYFSLEMPFDDLQERVMARLAMIPQKSVRNASLDEEQLARLGKAAKFIEKYPNELEIVDVPRGASIDTIEAIYNDVCSQGRRPKVVIVDYLTLMDYPDAELDDWLKQGKIAEQLHEFGRVHEVVVLSAMQLNDPKSNGKAGESQIGLHRIGRSRLIAHNANFCLQIEKRNNEEQFPNMSIHLIKSRRTELTRGNIYRDLACCALLNENHSPNEENSNIDDISNSEVFKEI